MVFHVLSCLIELDKLDKSEKIICAFPDDLLTHQHFGIVPDYLNGLTGLVSELQSLQSIYMASSDFRGF